jgi:hypothetical protein
MNHKNVSCFVSLWSKYILDFSKFKISPTTQVLSKTYDKWLTSHICTLYVGHVRLTGVPHPVCGPHDHQHITHCVVRMSIFVRLPPAYRYIDANT